MSALWADNPVTEPGTRTERPARTLLRPVTLPRQRLARVPFVLVLIALFGIGMAGLLMLNTTLQTQAFESQRLNVQATQLTYSEAALSRQVDQVQAPQQLALRASQLGMRPNPDPAFVKIPAGTISGYPGVVRGNEDPTQIVKTAAQLQAEAAAARQAAAARAAAALAQQQAAALAQQQAQAAQASASASASASAKPTSPTAPTASKSAKTAGSTKSASSTKTTKTSTGRN